MNFLRLRGNKGTAPLKENEKRILIQLQNNRQKALQNIHADLKQDFMSSICPDKQLKKHITAIFRNKFLVDDLRLVFLEYEIRLSIAKKGFGERLIIYHSVNPEIIVKIMVQDISFK